MCFATACHSGTQQAEISEQYAAAQHIYSDGTQYTRQMKINNFAIFHVKSFVRISKLFNYGEQNITTGAMFANFTRLCVGQLIEIFSFLPFSPT